MANLGDMVVKIVGDNSDFNRTIDNTQKAFEGLSKKLQDTGKKLSLFVTAPLLGIAGASLKAAADMEMSQVAFETMLGSAEKAKGLLGDLKDLAAKTPFQLSDLTAASKTLLQFGVGLDDVMPSIKAIGDIAQGNSQRFQSLSLAFGQVQASGRLMGQDLLQMINAGFNPLQVIAKETGKSMSELKKEMENGAISAETVAEAFKKATSEGGQFFNGMESASQTLTGKFSTLKDNVVEMGRSLGEVLLPIAKNVVDGISAMVQKFTNMSDASKKTILIVGGLAAAIGPLVLIVGKGISIVQGISKAVQTFSVVARAAQLTTYGLGAAQAVNTAATTAGITATAGMTVATRALAAAQAALPILAVIAGLAAIAGLAFNAAKETRELKKAAEETAIAYQDQVTAVDANNAKIPDLIQTYNDLHDKQDRTIQESRDLYEAESQLNELMPGVIDQWGLNVTALEAYNEQMDQTTKKVRDEAIAAQEQLRDRLEKNFKLWAATGWGAIAFGQLDKVKAQILEVDQTIQNLKAEGLSEEMKTIAGKAQDAELAFRGMEMAAAGNKEEQQAAAAAIQEQITLAEKLKALNDDFNAAVKKASEEYYLKQNQLNSLKQMGAIDELFYTEELKKAFDKRIQAAIDKYGTLGTFINEKNEKQKTGLQLLVEEFEATFGYQYELVNRESQAIADRQTAQNEFYAQQFAYLDQQKALKIETENTVQAAEQATANQAKANAEALAAIRKQEMETEKTLAQYRQDATFKLFEGLNYIQNFVDYAGEIRLQQMEKEGATEEELTKQRKKNARDSAIANKALALFNIGLSTAQAVIAALAMIPPNVPLSVVAAILGAAQAAAVAAKPLPALAEGGIVPARPGGTLATLGEAGQPEIVFPLDRLEDFMGAGGAGGGQTRIIVNLDSKPLLDKIFQATRNRTVLIDQGAVV